MRCDATLFRVAWTPRAALATGHGRLARRATLALRLEADGAVGIGEAPPLAGFPGGSLAAAERALRRWIEGGPPPRAGVARAALEAALLDLAARRSGLPLARALAGACEPRAAVRTAALLGGSDPRRLERGAAEAAARGFRAAKVKLPVDDAHAALERLRAAARAAGDALALRVDPNRAWSVVTLLGVARGAAGLPLEFVEEPVPPEAWARVPAEPGIPLALDESVATPTRAVRAIRRVRGRGAGRSGAGAREERGGPRPSALVLKPGLLGPATALALARAARAAGLEAVVSSALEGPAGWLAALAVAAALGAEGDAASIPDPGLGPPTRPPGVPVDPDAPQVPVPGGAGLGIDLDAARLRAAGLDVEPLARGRVVAPALAPVPRGLRPPGAKEAAA